MAGLQDVQDVQDEGGARFSWLGCGPRYRRFVGLYKGVLMSKILVHHVLRAATGCFQRTTIGPHGALAELMESSGGKDLRTPVITRAGGALPEIETLEVRRTPV